MAQAKAQEETKAEAKKMWVRYEVGLHFTTPFAAALPKDPDEIRAMLEHRQPTEAQFEKRKAAGEVMTPVEELAEEVIGEVPIVEEGVKGHATFKSDDAGLYYEGRCVRGHVKDCSLQVGRNFLKIPGFKAKVANHVYVEPEKLYLRKWRRGSTTGSNTSDIVKSVDGTELRMVHAMTAQGPISSLKDIDYLNDAYLEFRLKLFNDGVITEEHLKTIFEYGAVHGMGQDRGTGYFGQYEVVLWQYLG